MKLAQPDMDQILLTKYKEYIESATELNSLFEEMDFNESGTINLEEFEACMEDFCFSMHFQIKGLDIHDCRMFFRMLTLTVGD